MDIRPLSAFSNNKNQDLNSLSETSLNLDEFKLETDLQLLDDEIEYMLKKMADIGPYQNASLTLR